MASRCGGASNLQWTQPLSRPCQARASPFGAGVKLLVLPLAWRAVAKSGPTQSLCGRTDAGWSCLQSRLAGGGVMRPPPLSGPFPSAHPRLPPSSTRLACRPSSPVAPLPLRAGPRRLCPSARDSSLSTCFTAWADAKRCVRKNIAKNPEACGLVDRLVRLRALRAPPAVRRAAEAGWRRRWWALLSAALQRALASTLLGGRWLSLARPAAQGEPDLADVLALAGPSGPSLLPLRG